MAEALARCEENQMHGASRLVLSALGTAQAQLGDAAASAATVVELDRLALFPFTQPEQELGRGWAKVAAGDLPGGRRVLADAAESAAATGYLGAEAWLLHDIARLGDAASVVDRLNELATQSEGYLVATYAAHAAALVSRSSQRLVEVTDRFEQMGAMLLAAEAANEAAQALQDEGDRRAAAAMRLRSATLAEGCEGAVTPGLVTPVMVVPLTPRERDIATLAANGESSKDIADRLFLSIRTVNNHLQNVYSKMGVSGRRQLAEALADASDLSSAGAPPSRPASSSRQ
jgi:DNA-binding NarL/FixJ family response regulator